MDSYTQHLIEAEGEDSRAAQTGGGGGTGSGSGAKDATASSSSAAAAGKAAGEMVGLPHQTAERPHNITQDDLERLYLSPAMKLSLESLQPLLDEAQAIDRRLREAGL